LGISILHGKGVFIVTNSAFRNLSMAVLACSFLSPVVAHAAGQNNIAKFKSHMPQCEQRKGNRATTACLCGEYNRQVQSHESAKSGAMSQLCGGGPEANSHDNERGHDDASEIEVVNNSHPLSGITVNHEGNGPQGEIQNPSNSESPDVTSDETEDDPETEGSSASNGGGDSTTDTTTSGSGPDSGGDNSGDNEEERTPDTSPAAVQ
jgi:hypothetical protein